MTLCQIAFLSASLATFGHGRRVVPDLLRNRNQDADDWVTPAMKSSQGLTPAAAFNPGLSAGFRNKHQETFLHPAHSSIATPIFTTSRKAVSDRQSRFFHHKRVGQPQMIFERFTEDAMRIIIQAQEESRRMGHTYVGDEMIFLACFAQDKGAAAKVLKEHGATLSKMRKVVEGFIGLGAAMMIADVPFSPEAKRVLEICLQEAREFKANAIDTAHLLHALLRDDDGHAWEILNKMNVSPKKVKEAIYKVITDETEEEAEAPEAVGFQGATVSSSTSKGGTHKKGEKGTLDQYSKDLTKMAAEGKLEPIIGRGPEIDRAIQILARRKKNNPVLTGDPGVGKTAIAEGLATKIHENGEDLPQFLKGKRIMSLDLPAVVAGTKYRGDFEERMQGIIKDAVEKKDEIILMIDELHMLVNAGSSEGSMDAGNMLKPMLASGELQLIGATTLEEYRKYIEKDQALERRFQPVSVPEPTVDEAVQILQGLAKKYEAYHKLRYTPEAVEACVKLADKYVADRFLPDKAIDLLDEAGARVKLKKGKGCPMNDYSLEGRSRLDEFEAQIEEAVRERNWEKAADLQEQEEQLKQKLASESGSNCNPTAMENIFVEESDIERIVGDMTNIKVEKVSGDESASLMNLEQALHQRIIGQEEAVVAVARAVRRSRAGLKDPNRPIASFIFCGPTGVGKTELCKALTELYYGRQDCVLRFDMSEFMEKQSVSKLIGSPPGYVGYDDGSQLCDRIRRNPYSLILFDEIEKAHPDVFNIMLQILEDGMLTDSKGRTVSFKNALIIFTSNVGAQGIQKTIAGGGGFGFRAPDEDTDKVSYERLKSKVMDDLKNTFKPEFINRLDETVVFKPITKEQIGQIAELEFAKVHKRMVAQGLALRMQEAFKQKVVNEGFDPAFGARPLRRAMGKLLEDELASSVLSKPIVEGETAVIDLDGNGNVIVLRGTDGERQSPAASSTPNDESGADDWPLGSNDDDESGAAAATATDGSGGGGAPMSIDDFFR